MGREKPAAAAESREIISMGERILADALIDGVEQNGRFDQTTVQYDPQAGKCGGCIFYRGEAWDGPEACVLVAADVNAQGGCRIGIQGELPGALEDEVTDPMADPMQPNAEGEVEDEQSLDDALEDVDEALQLGEADEDDDEDDEDDEGTDTPTINISIDLDIDNGSHNASDGSETNVGSDADDGTEDDQPAELLPLSDVSPMRSSERHANAAATATWRDSGAGDQFRTIVGYASRFGAISEDLGGFTESIAPGAFRDALARDDLDCRLLFNHDPSAILARTGVNLELREDAAGLRMWARVDTNDFDVNRVTSKMRSGLITQCSFSFLIADDGEDWNMRDGYPHRVVRSVEQLLDVSVVTYPAYPQAKAEVLERAIRSGRVPSAARAIVAPVDPAGMSSSLTPEGEALKRLKAKARSRLHIIRFDLTR